MVVSSDHRLHRAARRRRAKAVDSDEWYAEVLRRHIDGMHGKSPGLKPSELPSDTEVRFWLRQFGLDEGDTLRSQPPRRRETAPFRAAMAKTSAKMTIDDKSARMRFLKICSKALVTSMLFAD